ncbi:predicted protein [Nematostella vectensis]|uniref:Proline-rich protein 5 n=2 Tax=Nematostella vectensis TaxID=45351 RepID=A7SGM9_NEMVE|nr:predicted protein [Nematostella vectensis]|eukprot:XP_001629159.1 predicted protein [Nematostella vectensis]
MVKEDWQVVSGAVTALFQRKKLANGELLSLTEKVRAVKTDVGNAKLCEHFKEILVKGMIILREDLKEKSGELLMDKLSSAWLYFFKYILPLLQAIFVNLYPPDGNSVRDLSLLSFRDIVVLKTKLEEAFQMEVESPPELIRMLLILQSVHDSPQPNKNYRKLETLVSYVVTPYLSSTGLRNKPIITTPTDPKLPRPASAAQLSGKQSDKLDTVHEVESNRRYTFTSSGDSACSSVFGSITSDLNTARSSVNSTNTLV